jgi:putative resolvase
MTGHIAISPTAAHVNRSPPLSAPPLKGWRQMPSKYGIALSCIVIYIRKMKLSVWAKTNGLAYQTAWRMWRNGKLPVPAEQLPTGTVIVHPPQTRAIESVAIYARVSSADQKAELERQLGRLAEYASRERLTVVRSVSDIGSGINGHRAKLLGLLSDPAVQTIVVEHRDRLARFGSEYIEAALSACGRKLVVVEESEMKDDLVQDMVDVLKAFCSRLYGRRAAKNRAAKALAAAQSPT